MSFNKACFLKDDELAGVAILNDSIVAPRKMRLVADLIRNKDVSMALALLDCNQKKCVGLFKKLLLSAVSNFHRRCEKMPEKKFYNNDCLYIWRIFVGSASTLKRSLPAPHGRAMTVRKRRSNVVVILKLLDSCGNFGKNNSVKKEDIESENNSKINVSKSKSKAVSLKEENNNTKIEKDGTEDK